MTSSLDQHPSADDHPWKVNQFANTLRLPTVTFHEGMSRMEMNVEEIHLRPGGLVHGGVFATLLDTVMGYEAHRAAPKDAEVLTIQLNLSMCATARLGEQVIATARVAHAGRRTAVVNGEIRRPDGKLLVTGNATFFIVEGGFVS